jgi:glutamate 5-kinase
MSLDARHADAVPRLADAQRVVVKLGSSLLIDPARGELQRGWLQSVAAEIAAMQRAGQQVLLVSSGAIALGRAYLELEPGQLRLDEYQAAAAAGQIILAHAYQELMAAHGIKVAQILLTPEDTENRRRYLNARSTLQTLLDLGVLPVINENDTVATQEIRYGDNDRLGARVAEMISADCLVLLSDVAGLYDADPSVHPGARLIPVVREITSDLNRVAGASRTAFGSGGMATKLAAARICMSAGCSTVIASGQRPAPLGAILDGGPCTWFLPHSTPLAARKQWIAGTLQARGQLAIDAGAAAALAAGSSLLPVGVTQVSGDFARGDAVDVTHAGQLIARGLVAYDSAEAQLIVGSRSADIAARIGYQGRNEIIHRDNLILFTAAVPT